MINISYSTDLTIECPEGTYGPSCESICKCDLWSSNKYCSRISGKCLGCKFGHYGVNCSDICYPKCKTTLCCSLLSSSEKKKKQLRIHLPTVKIKLEGQYLNVVPDVNVGHGLTIFQNTLDNKIKLDEKKKTKDIQLMYKNYNVSGDEYPNITISLFSESNNKEKEGTNSSFNIDLPVVLDTSVKIDKSNNINGVIGLGYQNKINDYLFREKEITENIASYSLEDNSVDTYISIIFGYIFDEEKDFVHKMSYWDLKKEDELNIKSKVDGIRTKDYSGALSINDTSIKFSLSENSSFILYDDIETKYYIKKYFFNDNNLDSNNKEAANNSKYNELKKGNTTTYYCYKTAKINKLSNFGFIINNFYHYYDASLFFIEGSPDCPKEYSKFIIEFNNETVGIVLGKVFLNKTIVTIDHEEKKAYFYSRNIEFFYGEKFTIFIPSISLEPMTISFIVTGSILFLNVASFLVYYIIERKKSKMEKID